jgi:hypothetical protein
MASSQGFFARVFPAWEAVNRGEVVESIAGREAKTAASHPVVIPAKAGNQYSRDGRD